MRRFAIHSPPLVRIATALVVVMCAVAHLGAAMHELAVPHRLCGLHGERAHVRPTEGDDLSSTASRGALALAEDVVTVDVGADPAEASASTRASSSCVRQGRAAGADGDEHCGAAVGPLASVAHPARPATAGRLELCPRVMVARDSRPVAGVPLLAAAPKTSPPSRAKDARV